MKERENRPSGFYLESLLMLLLFITMMVILVRVFAAASGISAEAARLNQAVEVASVAAEALAISEEYASSVCKTGEDGLVIRISDRETEATGGKLCYYTIDILDEQSQEEIYMLETAVFREEGR